MPISPHLQRKLQDALGTDAAEDLVGWMEAMDSNRGDIGELRHEMQLLSARMDARFAEFGATMEKGFRKQTQFFFVAWSVLLAAIIGLYAR